MNLEDRKMCAEFAGWVIDDSLQYGLGYRPDEVYGVRPGGGIGSLPHYDSDPAAACSLLPKLVRYWLNQKLPHNPPLLSEWLCDCLSLCSSEDPQVAEKGCRLIVEAVRACEEKKP